MQRGLTYGTRFAYRFNRVRDRLRRWRQRDLPVQPQRMSRAIAGEVGCDWKRTVAYAPYGQLSGCLYLHPSLRTDNESAQRIKAELIELFSKARDPESDALLFADAFDVAERYKLDPVAEGLPDVIAPSADGYQAQAKWSPFNRSLLCHDTNLPATHYMEGVVAIDAPGTRPGFPLVAELEDIAPTTLAMLGLPVPGFMDGRVLGEAFVEDPGRQTAAIKRRHASAVPSASGPRFARRLDEGVSRT
jgi:hypothetical protein